MGRVLAIRLSAVTYNEEEVFRTWPRLCDLAWPGKGQIFSGSWKPNPEFFPPPVTADRVRRGVVELTSALLEELRFGNWKSTAKNNLRLELADLEKALRQLETALADWQPQAANSASNAIEDCLDALEEKLT